MPHSLIATVLDPATPPRVERAVAKPKSPQSELAEATEETILDSIQLNADEQLPVGMATLYVQSAGEQLTFVAKYPGTSLGVPPEATCQPPPLALAATAREGASTPEVVDRRMFLWSRDNDIAAAIAKWSLELIRHGAHLEITDTSGWEIPWEMLTLRPPDAENTFLGVALAVSRRLPAVDPTREVSFPPHGPVLAFIAEEMRAAELQHGSLAGIEVNVEAMDSFRSVLQAGATPYALVYLACHGTSGDGDHEWRGSQPRQANIEGVWLGSKLADQQQLALAPFEVQMDRVRLRSAIFINACHSARVFKDPDIGNDAVEGFPALFMRCGSPGVIGTVGEISDAFAAEFAAGLLREAQASPGVALPELLRRQRAAIVKQVDRSQKTSVIRLVSAFMYVYYGSPNCTVSLAGAGVVRRGEASP